MKIRRNSQFWIIPTVPILLIKSRLLWISEKKRIRAHELLYVLEGNSYGMDDLNATNVEANHWQCNHCDFQTYSGKQVNFLHPWHYFF